MQANQTPPFLGLPPELRNRIYEDVLISEKVICVTSMGYPQWASPSLLQTCQQIRAEASELYFAANTFQVCTKWVQIGLCGAPQLREWLRVIGEPHKDMLRRIRIDWAVYPWSSPDGDEREGLPSRYEQYLEANGVMVRKGAVYC